MEVLGIVPARGGSKGVPLKNLQPLGGRPLIYYAIRALCECPAVTDVLLSTDSEEIAGIGREFGAQAPFGRPEALAGDDVPLDQVVAQAAGQMEKHCGKSYDYVVLVQPTCPLVRPETITAAVEQVRASDMDMLIAAREFRHLIWLRGPDGRLHQPERKNRQYMKPMYWEVGAPKVWRRSAMTESGALPDRIGLLLLDPAEAVDIDSHADFSVAELILQGREQERTPPAPRLVEL